MRGSGEGDESANMKRKGRGVNMCVTLGLRGKGKRTYYRFWKVREKKKVSTPRHRRRQPTQKLRKTIDGARCRRKKLSHREAETTTKLKPDQSAPRQVF